MAHAATNRQSQCDRRARGKLACRRLLRRSSAAFTLMEMLIVVAVIAVVAGTALALFHGTTEKTDEQMVFAECAEIRKAALRFTADMGEPPQLLAELLQSPDPDDECGGWWWRTDGAPAERLYAYDPATRRGWSGPYLNMDQASDADAVTVEARITGSSTSEEAVAVPSSGRCLTILLSRYATYPQKADGSRLVSHYQLDVSDEQSVAVRFVRDPLEAPADMQVVATAALGVAP